MLFFSYNNNSISVQINLVHFAVLSFVPLVDITQTPTMQGLQGRTQVEGLGVTLELDILQKTLLPAHTRLIIFAYFLLVDLSTYCKYHGMKLHANFKEHCNWVKM